MCLSVALCLTGCNKGSKNHIEPVKESQVMGYNHIKYLSGTCVGYIEEVIPYYIDWYNTIDSSQDEYIKSYSIKQESGFIYIPQDLYNDPTISDLTNKISDDINQDLENYDNRSITIATNAMPSLQPSLTLAFMSIGGDAVLNLSMDGTNNNYYILTDELWLTLRDDIVNAKTFYYGE